jgi:hypothetical protein
VLTQETSFGSVYWSFEGFLVASDALLPKSWMMVQAAVHASLTAYEQERAKRVSMIQEKLNCVIGV